jgi:hypothetical protein
MNIWQFQNKLTQRLLWWGAGSMVVGLFLLRGNAFWKAVGWQFVGWGFVDALIALFGRASMNQRLEALENPGLPEVHARESENLRRLLWLNAFLDILYVMGGKAWADRDRGDGRRAATGLGIALQGLFLLIFDVFHAMECPDETAR